MSAIAVQRTPQSSDWVPDRKPPSVPVRRTALHGAILALLAYAAITVVLFPNVVAHLADAFPGDLGDPPSQAWILAWDWHALIHTPTRLSDAPVFYPFHDVLAYQDSLLGLLPLAAPILLATGSAVLAYNVLFLLTFVLCAWGAYLLGRLLVGDSRAAFLAGLIYAFSAYRMVHLYHLNLLSGMWIPLTLLCWERAWRGEQRCWIGVGLFFVLQALTALYYAAFLAVALTILYGLRWWFPLRGGEHRTSGAAGFKPDPAAPDKKATLFAPLTALCCGLVLVPFFLPYLRVEHALGASRGLGQAVYFSADLRDFLHSADLSLLYGWTGHALGVRPGVALQFLWPGLVALGLALYALYSATRERRRANMPRYKAAPGWHDDAVWRDRRRDYALLGLIAAVLCLGPFLKVWGHQTGVPLPYVLLYPLPGFAGLRDPARFGSIYTLCLAILATYGTARLLALAPLRGAWRPRALVAALCLGVLAEAWIRPLPAVPVPVGAAVPRVYRWLAARPGNQPVLELPIGLENKTIWAWQAQTMYFATVHWHPIVNGTGGFAPPGYDHDILLYNSFPAPAALRLLRARGVRYVIVHRSWLGARAADGIRARAAALLDTHLLVHWTDADLYSVSP